MLTTKPVVIVILCLILVLFTSPVSANLIITEAYPDLPSDQDESQAEWVELFNSGTESETLEHLYLQDLAGNQLYLNTRIPLLGSTLNPHTYLVIYREGSNFSLNNASDTIFLYTASPSATLLDTLSYSQTSPDHTVGRISGSSEIYTNLTPSPGNPNPVPPTPTPTPTPQPTSTVSSKSPTPSPTTTPPPSSPSPTPTYPVPTSTHIRQLLPPPVLGISTQSASPASSVSASPPPSHPSESSLPPFPYHSLFVIISGAAFIASSLVNLVRS